MLFFVFTGFDVRDANAPWFKFALLELAGLTLASVTGLLSFVSKVFTEVVVFSAAVGVCILYNSVNSWL